ncbi:MAG TPA: DUF3105 domain-containing protein [Acidimicrobiales bacterium]|nr:DUF3105 domain-containing protein [Acidimicrobiales bacterium]
MRRSAVFVLAGALVLAGCGGEEDPAHDGELTAAEVEPVGDAAEGVEGVIAYDIADNSHVEGAIDHRLDPPVAGPHDPVWANCGFYDAEIPNENAVHSLEHGAVWITYTDQVEPAALDRIRELVATDEHLLASAYPGQASPIVLTAWNRQLALDSIDDPRVVEFVETYLRADTSPEPGTTCSGGAG